jgi:hypothetical protein
LQWRLVLIMDILAVPFPRAAACMMCLARGRFGSERHVEAAPNDLNVNGKMPEMVDRTTVVPRPLQIHSWQQPQALKDFRDKQKQVTNTQQRLAEMQAETTRMLAEEEYMRSLAPPKPAAVKRHVAMPGYHPKETHVEADFSPASQGGTSAEEVHLAGTQTPPPRQQLDFDAEAGAEVVFAVEQPPQGLVTPPSETVKAASKRTPASTTSCFARVSSSGTQFRSSQKVAFTG